MSSIAKVVASVGQIAFQSPRLDLIRDLERDSQTLDRIGIILAGIGKVCMLAYIMNIWFDSY